MSRVLRQSHESGSAGPPFRMIQSKPQALNLKDGHCATAVFHLRGRLAGRRDSTAAPARRGCSDRAGSCRFKHDRLFRPCYGADRRCCRGTATAGRPVDPCSGSARGDGGGVDRFYAAGGATVRDAIGWYRNQPGNDRTGRLVDRCAALRAKADRSTRALRRSI